MTSTDSFFPSNYLCAADLQGRRIRLTIKGWQPSDKPLDGHIRPELSFHGTEKVMGLNITNCNRLGELFGTKELEDYVGKTITLYPTRVPFGKKIVDAIRIDPAEQPPAPAAAPAPAAETGLPAADPLPDMEAGAGAAGGPNATGENPPVEQDGLPGGAGHDVAPISEEDIPF